jgi:GT2 family glycosyltransferase
MIRENTISIDISIIIVNYRGWKHLKECLNYLKSFRNSRFSFEVIVVDNCSNDGQIFEFQKHFPDFNFILNTGNNGFANGCNFGATLAKGDFLLFLNPDVLISESAIFELLATIRQQSELWILSCKHFNNRGKEEQTNRFFPSYMTINGFLRAINRLVTKTKYSDRISKQNTIIYPDWVSGSLILISKKHFIDIGYWDENYWLYYEDIDLCWRARMNGGRIGLHNQVSVVHNHGGATRINLQTALVTKAEVTISLHVFLSRHYSCIKALFLHMMVIADVLIVKLIPALLGIPFFFIKRFNLYSRLYIKLIYYYIQAIYHGTWLSPRSIKYKKPG